LTIDLSLSEVARGKVMVAAQQGKPIPLGWALDRAGKPTTDAKAALDGMMLPAGGVKGAMLALVVELLCVSLTGAQFGFEADSFFVEAGNQPRLGQAFLVIDPAALAGADVYHSRVEALIEIMCADADVRLPGERRAQLAQRALVDGVDIPDALLARLTELAEPQSTSLGTVSFCLRTGRATRSGWCRSSRFAPPLRAAGLSALLRLPNWTT
jgi:(2R)-3-sulfolactate dehydrogenase (NADP+)